MYMNKAFFERVNKEIIIVTKNIIIKVKLTHPEIRLSFVTLDLNSLGFLFKNLIS